MSYLSEFEHTKLEAQVHPGIVVQTQYISDPRSGRRRIPKTKVWKVERLLGRGSFGEVRLEVCTEENEQRAVKRIWATGNAFKVQYERELKALLEFSKPKYKDSAVFVEFFGWFEDPESVYLAMEYVPLGDLEENLKAVGGTLKEPEVRDITIQILEGLEIMHQENFVHRDLKPKNILVCQRSPAWWVKLADFGLSKRQSEETAYRTQTGTQAYMAPEILKYVPNIKLGTSEYTNAVDIWALGCIVYRLSSGIVPFPPGLSLVTFCGDESTFPSQRLALSELGIKFVQGLLMPYPARRLTAQQALAHNWMKLAFESQDLNPKHSTSRTIDSNISFGQYDTETHAGLQSHSVVLPSKTRDFGVAKNDPLKTRYHPPTVEDDDEQSEVPHNAKIDKSLDLQEEGLVAQASRSSRPSLQVEADDFGNLEFTIKPPPDDAKTAKPNQPRIHSEDRQQSINEDTNPSFQTVPNRLPEQIIYATNPDIISPPMGQNNLTQQQPSDKQHGNSNNYQLKQADYTMDSDISPFNYQSNQTQRWDNGNAECSTSELESASDTESHGPSGVYAEMREEIAPDSELNSAPPPGRTGYKSFKSSHARDLDDNFHVSRRRNISKRKISSMMGEVTLKWMEACKNNYARSDEESLDVWISACDQILYLISHMHDMAAEKTESSLRSMEVHCRKNIQQLRASIRASEEKTTSVSANPDLDRGNDQIKAPADDLIFYADEKGSIFPGFLLDRGLNGSNEEEGYITEPPCSPPSLRREKISRDRFPKNQQRMRADTEDYINDSYITERREQNSRDDSRKQPREIPFRNLTPDEGATRDLTWEQAARSRATKHPLDEDAEDSPRRSSIRRRNNSTGSIHLDDNWSHPLAKHETEGLRERMAAYHISHDDYL